MNLYTLPSLKKGDMIIGYVLGYDQVRNNSQTTVYFDKNSQPHVEGYELLKALGERRDTYAMLKDLRDVSVFMFDNQKSLIAAEQEICASSIDKIAGSIPLLNDC